MANTVETILLQLNLNADQIKQALQDTRSEVEKLKGRLKEQQEDLKVANKDNKTAYDNLKKSIIETETTIKALTAQEKNYAQILEKTERANLETTDSYEKKNAAVIAGSRTLKLYSQEQIAASEELTQLRENVTKTREELQTQDKAMKDGRSSVGLYEEGFKTFRQEIKEATIELKKSIDKFGAQSKEAQDAKQKLSDLKDEQQDLNKELESFQPEGKFAAFANVASGVAGGFAALQGGMALFGAESEDVNKTLLKVQSTMALFQGLKAFAELGKDIKVLLPILGIQLGTTKAAAVANTELAVAEGEAAVGATALGTAVKTAMGPIGLIVAGIAVAITLFSALSASGAEASKTIESALDNENKAHKESISLLKEYYDTAIDAASGSLQRAELEKRGADEILKLQQNLLDAKESGRNAELDFNKKHLNELKANEEKLLIQLAQQVDDDERKKLEDLKDSNEQEIAKAKERNEELLREEKAAAIERIRIAIEADQRSREEKNKLASLRIATIKSDSAREIETIKQNTQAQLDAVLDTEANAEEKRKLIRIAGEQAIAQAVFNQKLKTVQEENALSIALTKEGTLERIAAETEAAKKERDQQLNNTKLTATQRQLLVAESVAKLNELEQQRLQFIESQNQKTVELEKRKQDALLQIQKIDAGTDIEKRLAANLNAINVNTEAELSALENKADEEKAISQQQITDNEQLQARIKEIDETTAAEKLAIVKQSAADIKQVTDESNAERIQKAIDQKQLELDAASPTEEYAARIALLQEQQNKELSVVGATEAQKDLIRKKYSKIKNDLDDENNRKTLASLSSTLGAAASLFKKGTNEYKAFASAQALIDTYTSATAAYKSVVGIPVVGPALAVAAAAAAVLAGLKNVQQINSVKAATGIYLNDPSLPGNETSDSIPARLSKGESVINARSTRMFLPLLSHINQLGGGVAFSRGGFTDHAERFRNLTGIRGYAGGGVPSQSFTYVTQGNGNDVVNDYALYNNLQRVIQSMPPQFLAVEDYRAADARVTQIESRANH